MDTKHTEIKTSVINGIYLPTLIVLCGTTFGAKLLPPIIKMVKSIFGGIPAWLQFLVFDTDENGLRAAESYGQQVMVVHLGDCNLREMAAHASKKPAVADTLRGIPLFKVPELLATGSAKILAFTVAAWQTLYWETGSGVHDIHHAAINRLRVGTFQSPSGGLSQPVIRVLYIAGAFGGVGAIGPFVSALTLRKMASDTGMNLEISVLWIEAHEDESNQDVRIAGNMGANYKMMEAAQSGQFRLRISGNGRLQTQGGDGVPIFDYVLRASENNGNQLIPKAVFDGAISRFALAWAANPISDEFRSKFEDKRRTING
jgi:hypothetical protein